MPKKSPHPHVDWRDGKPRFKPGPQLRGMDHVSRDLRHENGSWYTRGECVDWSERLQRELADRAKDRKVAKAKPKPKRKPTLSAERMAAAYSIGRLVEDWFRSTKFQRPKSALEERRLLSVKAIYSRRTIMDYRQKARVIESHDPDLWAAPVEALAPPIVFGLYEELVEQRGLATARGVVRVLSIAIEWGKRRGKHALQVNPATGVGMTTLPARVRFGTRAEIDALVKAADALHMPEIGDMIVLGVWTGQRQGDRLLLTDKGTLNGRRIFRQSKTGAIVSVPESPQLKARLAASAERRKAKGIVHPRIVLDERRWEPWPDDDGNAYRKRFQIVRAAAASGIHNGQRILEKAKTAPTLLGDEERGILPFFEANLRDTAVTWLALAGATIPEIVAITGHTLESATRILKHYLAQHPELASSAIRKMIDWYDADGETEFTV